MNPHSDLKPQANDAGDIIPRSTVALMAQICLLAACMRKVDDAKLISDGLQPMYGWLVPVAMTQSAVLTARGEYADAMALLNRVMVKHPQVMAVKFNFAVIKKQLGVQGWRNLAQEVANNEQDPLAAKMAKELLEQAGSMAPAKSAVAPSALAFAGLRFV
jgi:Bacterial type III secretion protein (HrpB1_HrpK)